VSGVSVAVDDGSTSYAAPTPSELPDDLGAGRRVHRECLTAEDGLRGCLACGHPELFTQKAFPRAAGIAIVVVAAVLAPFTWYASLAVAALIDALLYWLAPDVVVCYVCGARHRGFATSPRHPRFDREIDERLRYGERAVMGKPMRPDGTADAPEPEH
jgi:hypothetical protein